MKGRYLAGLVVAVCLVGAGLSGCGKEAPPAKPPANPFAGLPFVLVPDKDGNLEPRTADGAPIQPSDKPPEAAQSLRNLAPGRCSSSQALASYGSITTASGTRCPVESCRSWAAAPRRRLAGRRRPAIGASGDTFSASVQRSPSTSCMS